MLEASRELAALVRRYEDTLDEISHRELAKAAEALLRRANWMKSSHPGGPPADEGNLEASVG